MAKTVKTFQDPTPFTVRVSTSTGGTGGTEPSGVLTPQHYGSPGPASSLAEAQAGVAQDAYIVKALDAAAANVASGSGPTDVYLSPGYWLAIGKTGTYYGWGGIKVPPGVSIVGAGVGATYVTWNRHNWGYPCFGVGKDSTVHDLSFTSPADMSVSPINPMSPATAVAIGANASVYNVDCTLGANMNCGTSGVGTAGAVFDNITADGCAPWADLAQEIVYGQTYDTLSCTPLETALSSGTLLYLYSYPTSGTRAEVLKGAIFQSCYLAAAAAVGATTLSVRPFVAGLGGTEASSLSPGASLPSGSLVQTIIDSTGIAITGGYEAWSTAPPVAGNPNWNIGAIIRNCVAINYMAADIFINMGYKATIENCYGSIGHDMNFDFEYCMKSIMQNNVSRYGGNRGCAVETVNSECQVLNNDIMYAFADGIRVTTDASPNGNPYTTGGHIISGNTVRYCNRGIACQGVYATIEGNTSEYNSVYGVWLNNVGLYGSVTAATNTLLSKNTIRHNALGGVAISNTDNVSIDATNEIAYSGYLGTLEPNRAAPTLTLESVASSTFVTGTPVAVAYGWTSTVLGAGGTMIAPEPPPGLPGYATPTADNQGFGFDVAVPSEADGIVVYAQVFTKVWAGTTVDDWMLGTLHGNLQRLGYVGPDGAVTYDPTAKAGLLASVNTDGSLHVTVTAIPAASAPYMGPAPGVWLQEFTGAVNAITIDAANIHDNGWYGIRGRGGLTVGGADIANHTTMGMCVSANAPLSLNGGSISGSYQGAYAGWNTGVGNGGAPVSPGATITNVTFSGIADAAIVFDGGVNDGLVSGCTFGTAGAPVHIGVFANGAEYGVPNGGTPITVEHSNFQYCTTPIDNNGGPNIMVVLGAGNTGVPAS